MQASRTLLTRELAITRGNSPDAYDVEKSTQTSGVARRIANVARDQAMEQRAEFFEAFEERQLLPRILQVHDLHCDPVLRFGDVTGHVEEESGDDYESSSERQQRAIAALDAGLISPARAAVESGWYRDVAAATAAGLPDSVVGGLSVTAPPVPGTAVPATGAVAAALMGGTSAAGQ